MKPLIIANWKMNPLTADKAVELTEGIKKAKDNNFVVCPPFVFLSLIEGVKKGAQDVFWEKEGAFTGEVSPLMLKDLGCEYVIIGHSERRGYFFETDEMVNKKIKAVLDNELIPIFCIGETEKERKEGKTEQVLKREIEKGLKDVDLSKVIIAYEPIWAIGTGNACEVEEAARMREAIEEILGAKIPILYGGSVKGDNAKEYVKEAGFQGLLVGGASLKAEEFLKILEETA